MSEELTEDHIPLKFLADCSWNRSSGPSTALSVLTRSSAHGPSEVDRSHKPAVGVPLKALPLGYHRARGQVVAWSAYEHKDLKVAGLLGEQLKFTIVGSAFRAIYITVEASNTGRSINAVGRPANASGKRNNSRLSGRAVR